MIYEMRKVLSGQSHYLEGLQTVQLVKSGEVAHDVELVRADDIAPAVWSIRRQSVPDESGAPSTVIGDLRASTPNGTKRKIVTTDYVTASELAHWLKAHEPGKKLHELSFDYQPHETLVPFKNVDNDCKR